ncbi:MAG TPA: LamG domain-containing protein [Pyrinomonadaceae bacterium]|nr:LamG domain-containing protein [Pyrinomonadaceae bacterium]
MSNPVDYATYTRMSATFRQSSYISFDPFWRSLGGDNPYSLAAWIKIDAFNYSGSGDNVILSLQVGNDHQNLLTLNTTALGKVLLCWAGGTTWIQTGTVERGVWYHFAFTWDGQTSSFYLNGNLVAAIEPTAAPLLVKPAFQFGLNLTQPPPSGGASFQGCVSDFVVWSICLSAAEVYQYMWKEVPTTLFGIQMAYDFTTNPPTIAEGETSVQLNNTSFVTEAPAILSQYGYGPAVPGPGTEINPGGSASFTIIAWVNPGNPDEDDTGAFSGCIFSNGDETDPDNLTISIINNVTVVQFGSALTIIGGINIPLYEWTCIAVTFGHDDEPPTCTIYVNATLDQSVPVPRTAGTTATAAPLLLGRLSDGEPVDGFVGYLQSLSVWDVHLSAAEVQAAMLRDTTYHDGCVAYFDCTFDAPQDTVAGQFAVWDENVLALGPDVVVSPAVQAVPSVQPQPQLAPDAPRAEAPREKVKPMVITSAEQLPPPGLLSALSSLLAPRTPQSTIEPFGEEHKERMLAEFKHALATVRGKSVREKWLDDYQRRLDEVFETARNNPEALPGPRMTVKEEDGYHKLIYHLDGEETEIFWISTELEVDACTFWWMSMGYTLVNGACLILEIPAPTEVIQEFVLSFINEPAVVALLATSFAAQAAAAAFTATTILAMLGLLYELGYLSTFFRACVRSAGWLMMTRAIIAALDTFVPALTPRKIKFIAGAVVLTAQLVVQISNYQSSCGANLLLAAQGA